MKLLQAIFFCLAISSTAVAAPKYEDNCRFSVPVFYDEVEKAWPRENIATLSTFFLLNDYLEKPFPAEDSINWVLGAQTDRYCISGTENRKSISYRTAGIIKVPAQYSNTGKDQVIAFSVSGNYDPDRGQGSLSSSTGPKIIDVSEAYQQAER